MPWLQRESVDDLVIVTHGNGDKNDRLLGAILEPALRRGASRVRDQVRGRVPAD